MKKRTTTVVEDDLFSAALFSTPTWKPELVPILPRAPSQGTIAGSATPMAAARDEQQPQEQAQRGEQRRPDARMDDVYDSLAQRLRDDIRARRRRASAEVTARTKQGAGGVEGGAGEGGHAVEEALDDGGAAVKVLPQQGQLWVAIAGAPGSGKTTLAVRRPFC